jgi:hypothetical protein
MSFRATLQTTIPTECTCHDQHAVLSDISASAVPEHVEPEDGTKRLATPEKRDSAPDSDV